MKNVMFRDQVNVISSYFEQWNHCEQLVFLYALLNKLTSSQSKFLNMVLEQATEEDTDLQQMIDEANDSGFVSSLYNESKECVVQKLLSHLPLLHPDNEKAKAQYMMIIPKVFHHSVENRVHVEESQQILSYALIHPAIKSNERKSLGVWMRHLEETIKSNQNFYLSSCNQGNPSQTNLSWQSSDEEQYNNNRDNKFNAMYSSLHGLGSRSLPAGLGTRLSQAVHRHHNHHPNNDSPNRNPTMSPLCVASGVGVTDFGEDTLTVIPRRQSNIDQAPLSPQGSVASSGSGSSDSTEEARNSFDTDGSGMKDVPSWLKSLRLHKYAYLFAQMSYEEMMNLTETQLEAKNVTKGARHKIVLSITKLKERPGILRKLKKDVVEGHNLNEALNELKSFIQTPIKAYLTDADDGKNPESRPESPPQSPNFDKTIPEEDLPSQLTSIMGKICTQLLVTHSPDDENVNMFLMLIDRCLGHESFTPAQKRRLFSWKQQTQKIWHPLPPRRSLESRLNRSHISHPSPPGTLPLHRRPVSQQRNNVSSLVNSVPVQHQNDVKSHQSNAGVKQSASLNEHVKPANLNIQRRNSAPVRTNQIISSSTPSYKPVHEVVDTEITTRLESLCLRMTEHALAGSDGSSTQY